MGGFFRKKSMNRGSDFAGYCDNRKKYRVHIDFRTKIILLWLNGYLNNNFMNSKLKFLKYLPISDNLWEDSVPLYSGFLVLYKVCIGFILD